MTDKFDYLVSYSKKKLKELIASEEHNAFEDEEEQGNWIHAYWDCEICAAEQVIERRRHLKDSKKSGHCSLVSIPGVQGVTYRNIDISELGIGYQARYLSKPGSSEYPYEYAEVISIEREGKKYHVEWRRTNTDSTVLSFFTIYDKRDNLNVSYATPVAPRD